MVEVECDQVGAFTERANADKKAAAYKQRASSARVGSVYVTRGVTSSGQELNLVQVGRFTTFAAAISARSQLGDYDAVIVTLHR